MSYREKLEKYKKNQLPEEEKKKVEDEIEKAEAINEYLADKLEEELIEDDEAFQDGNEENTFREEKDSRMEEKEAQFEEYVKKSIHRIFRKISVGTGAVLFVALLFVQFGLSPLVSLFYYNPAKQIKVKMESDGDSGELGKFGVSFELILESFQNLRCRAGVQILLRRFLRDMEITIFRSIQPSDMGRKAVRGLQDKSKEEKCKRILPGIFSLYRTIIL